MIDPYPAEKYSAAIDYLDRKDRWNVVLPKAAWGIRHASRGRWNNQELRARHDALLAKLESWTEANRSAAEADAEAQHLAREIRLIGGALRAERRYG